MVLTPILWYKPRRDDSRDVKIYMSRNNQKHYYSLKFSVTEKEWNKKMRLVNEDVVNSVDYNFQIRKSMRELESIMINNPDASLKKVVELYENKTTGKDSLIGFAQAFIDECKAGKVKRSGLTVEQYQSKLKTFETFQNERRPVDFHLINKEWYDEFVGWMRTDKKVSENTIGDKLQFLKMIMSEANERGISTVQEHKKKYFKKPSEETEKIYLNTDEIDKFIAAKVPKHLEHEKDRFIVSYFFLLRFDDSTKINKGNVFEENGQRYFRKTPEKTKDNVVIPIKPIVWDILVKNNFKFNNDKNAESNRKLKKIGEIAKIKQVVEIGKEVLPKYKFITTHTARRSGATNLYLQKASEKMIMQLGGWKTIETFRRYIRVGKMENAILASELEFFK